MDGLKVPKDWEIRLFLATVFISGGAVGVFFTWLVLR